MKTKLIVLILCIVAFTSCNDGYKESYSFPEAKTLVSIGKLSYSYDSIEVGLSEETKEKFPILIGSAGYSVGYYPGISEGKELRYYKVKVKN